MKRYLVERIRDGAFLELELPIDVDTASKALSAPGAFSGTISPDVGGLRGEDGALLIDPHSTYLHEEVDDVIRGTWLVTRSEMAGEQWKIEGKGFSEFFAGRPFEGEYRGINVDPVSAARHVVQHAQGFAGADAGITLRGSSTVRVGTNSEQELVDAEARLYAAEGAYQAAKTLAQAAKKDLEAAEKIWNAQVKADEEAAKAARDAYDKSVKDKDSAAIISARRAAATDAAGIVTSRRAARQAALGPLILAADVAAADEEATKATLEQRKAQHEAAKEALAEDGGSYKMLWWDTPDCMDLILTAIEDAGSEWYEHSYWDADRTRIVKEIRVVEQVGAKRDNLQFIEGDNIVESVVVEDDVAEYANTIVAIGAGEGRAALRVTVGVPDSRLRTVHVLDAKHLTSRASLEREARAELARRRRKLRITDIRVIDHPNAQHGTYGVGDYIYLDVDVDWLGRQKMWRRIVEYDWGDGDTYDLTLED